MLNLVESVHHATNTDGIGVSLLAGVKQPSVSDTRALAALDQYLVMKWHKTTQDTAALKRKQKRLKANKSNDRLGAVDVIDLTGGSFPETPRNSIRSPVIITYFL
ncbi:hypothetical protein Egran_02027 [Elaphomyces granulatus]|uniref:Uncharacterized protein n=1 Tax=Elaphomyces granulatus TaxID=519963 RepID=A0A232M1H3_9EURO|nr:hypothetical protein Egran_02027 [Elaphomyces granulatus]